ncbi:MAG TPA: glycosyltransferase family 39 protein [Candidatus Acidoferrum sp.]|nr:glycosyltransferase family 39 protein [Candidatus Acidoferrum sp.]
MNSEESGGPRIAKNDDNQTLSSSQVGHSLAAVPPVVWLLALIFACLAAFIGKPAHIDDTLFLRAAEQIQRHPANFYGFEMNWFGATRPMVENFDNPPLACYYLALLGSMGGWSEPVLHLGFIIPALAAAAGIFFLARNYTGRPMLAAIAAVATPLFVISATTLMCDLLLLAFWTWTLVFFENGLRNGSRRAYFISGVLAGLAFWTKFSGLALIPLLLAYGWFKKRRWAPWLIAPLLPLAFVAAYEWITFLLYRKGVLLSAAGVSSSPIPGGSGLGRQFVGLSFVGGCFLPTLFCVPWLWSVRSILKGLCVVVPCLALYPYLGVFALLWDPEGRPDWLLCVQSAFFIAGGVHILLLALTDFWEHRDANSLLLLFWVLGVFVFATLFNWTLNGRSILPMAGAVGILLARRFEQHARLRQKAYSTAILWPLLPGAALSLLLARSDCDLANTGRTAARDLCSRYQSPEKTLWFEGHWGFQYYMEQRGARALERGFSQPAPGDFVAVPSEAVNLFDLSTYLVHLVATLEYPPKLPCATMNSEVGTGFYAATAGPFPWTVGYISPERYYVFQVTKSLSSTSNALDEAHSPGALVQQFWFERQMRACQRAIRRNPTNTMARLELAAIAEQQCEPAKAISQYRAVLNLTPDSDRALDKLAWILATSSEAQLRNGKEAVGLAERASGLTGHSSARVLTTLGAAYAEQGLFAQAVAASREASELARKNNQPEILSQNEALLQLYQAKRPFHQE